MLKDLAFAAIVSNLSSLVCLLFLIQTELYLTEEPRHHFSENSFVQLFLQLALAVEIQAVKTTLM